MMMLRRKSNNTGWDNLEALAERFSFREEERNG